MSNINVFERLFKLWGKISMLVMDGKRDPEMVAEQLQKIVTEPASDCRLKPGNSIECPSLYRFEAKEKFRIGTVDGIKFSDFSPDFKKQFFGKVEINIPKATLRCYKLLRDSTDLRILRAIEDGKEVISLAHLYHLLVLQGERQDGILLTNSGGNIFHIFGNDGNLWAVSASWFVDGWLLTASPIGMPNEWYDGQQVFSL